MNLQREIDAEEVLERRKIPCICPRQFEKDAPFGEHVGVTFSRGVAVEELRCSAPGCGQRWKRVNA